MRVDRTGWKAGVLQRGKLEKGTCPDVGSMLRRKMRRRRELRRQKNKQF